MRTGRQVTGCYVAIPGLLRSAGRGCYGRRVLDEAGCSGRAGVRAPAAGGHGVDDGQGSRAADRQRRFDQGRLGRRGPRRGLGTFQSGGMTMADKSYQEASGTGAKHAYVGTLSEARCPQCHAELPLEPVQPLLFSEEQAEQYIVQGLDRCVQRTRKRQGQTETDEVD